VKKIFLPLVILGIGLSLWQLVSSVANIPSWLLPSPTEIVVSIFTNPVLLNHVRITAGEFLPALGIASALGILIGVLLAKMPIFRKITYPYVIVLGSLPASCFAPIINLWLGIGTLSKIAVAIIMSMLVIVTATTTGISQVDRYVIEAARLDGASFIRRTLSIELPLALPNVFTGLRMGWSMALIGAVVSELYGAHGGLGYFMFVKTKTFRTVDVFAGVAVLASLSYAGFLIFDWIEKKVVTW